MAGEIAPLFTWRTGITESDLPPTTRHVLLTISLYMTEKGESGFPGMERLAHDTGLTRRAVGKHVQLAAKEGFIEIIKCTGEGQGWRRNYYVPCLPEYAAARVEKLRADQLENRVEAARKRGERGSPPQGGKGGERGSPPSKKVVNLTTQGGEPECNKVGNHVPTNSPVNTSVTPRAGARPLPAGVPEPSRCAQIGADYVDPHTADGAAFVAAGLVPAELQGQAALLSTLPAGWPFALWLDWLKKRQPGSQVVSHMHTVQAEADAHGVTPAAVLIGSIALLDAGKRLSQPLWLGRLAVSSAVDESGAAA